MTTPEDALAWFIKKLDELFYSGATVLVIDRFCTVQGTLNRRDRTLPTVYIVNGYGSALFQATNVFRIEGTDIYLRTD